MTDPTLTPEIHRDDPHLYRKLFFATFTLSAFTFGGGYVIVSLMRGKFVNDLRWIDEEEMLNLTAIAQSAPGPVAINASVLLGLEVGGWRGAFTALLGTIIPPFAIITVISYFYELFRTNALVNNVLLGMQAGVAAVIMDVVLSLGHSLVRRRDPINILLMIAAFVATFVLKINIVLIILTCALVGVARVVATRQNRGSTP